MAVTNVRIRADLVEDLKRRTKDDRHASLNGLVNEICRIFLVSGTIGYTPVGLTSLADELEESVGTDQLWVFMSQEPIPDNVFRGRNVAYSCMGTIERVTSTTVEVSLDQGVGRKPYVLVKSELRAWFRVHVTDEDIKRASDMSKILEREIDPIHCAVNRIDEHIGIGAESYKLSAYEFIKINKHSLLESTKNEPVILNPMFLIETDTDGNRVLTFHSSNNEDEYFRLVGLKLTLPMGGTLLDYKIFGCPNLLLHEYEIKEGETLDLDELNGYPLVIFPNHVSMSVKLNGNVSVSSSGVRDLDKKTVQLQEGKPIIAFAKLKKYAYSGQPW